MQSHGIHKLIQCRNLQGSSEEAIANQATHETTIFCTTQRAFLQEQQGRPVQRF